MGDERIERKQHGERFLLLREEFKDDNGKIYSQRKMAEALEVSQSRVAQLENMENSKADVSYPIAKAYRKLFRKEKNQEISYEYLFGESNAKDYTFHNIHNRTGLTELAIQNLTRTNPNSEENKVENLPEKTEGVSPITNIQAFEKKGIVNYARSHVLNLILENDPTIIDKIGIYLLGKLMSYNEASSIDFVYSLPSRFVGNTEVVSGVTESLAQEDIHETVLLRIQQQLKALKTQLGEEEEEEENG